MKIETEVVDRDGFPLTFGDLIAGRVYLEDGINPKYVIATDEGTAVHLDTGTEVNELHAAPFRYREVHAKVVIES